MNISMGRTLVVAASSAGLIVGGGLSASASTGGGQSAHDKDGWVIVCQQVKDKDKGHDDKGGKGDKYEGQYKVKDSKGDVWKFYLKGKDDCNKVRVHEGWVKVKVLKQPDKQKLKSDEEQTVKVKQGDYKKVTFTYRAEKKGNGAAYVAPRAA
jgi:uncharacterized membrane protein